MEFDDLKNKIRNPEEDHLKDYQKKAPILLFPQTIHLAALMEVFVIALEREPNFKSLEAAHEKRTKTLYINFLCHGSGDESYKKNNQI
jgi:hypothetical protein